MASVPGGSQSSHHHMSLACLVCLATAELGTGKDSVPAKAVSDDRRNSAPCKKVYLGQLHEQFSLFQLEKSFRVDI